MEPTTIEETSKTPLVRFNPETGILEIKGRVIPENAIQFFKPIYEWLEAYSLMPKPDTRVEIRLEYLNDSSSKCMYDVFRKLMVVRDKGNNVEINWYYQKDDDDMLETGEDYQDVTRLPFTFIETDE